MDNLARNLNQLERAGAFGTEYGLALSDSTKERVLRFARSGGEPFPDRNGAVRHLGRRKEARQEFLVAFYLHRVTRPKLLTNRVGDRVGRFNQLRSRATPPFRCTTQCHYGLRQIAHVNDLLGQLGNDTHLSASFLSGAMPDPISAGRHACRCQHSSNRRRLCLLEVHSWVPSGTPGVSRESPYMRRCNGALVRRYTIYSVRDLLRL